MMMIVSVSLASHPRHRQALLKQTSELPVGARHVVSTHPALQAAGERIIFVSSRRINCAHAVVCDSNYPPMAALALFQEVDEGIAAVSGLTGAIEAALRPYALTDIDAIMEAALRRYRSVAQMQSRIDMSLVAQDLKEVSVSLRVCVCVYVCVCASAPALGPAHALPSIPSRNSPPSVLSRPLEGTLHPRLPQHCLALRTHRVLRTARARIPSWSTPPRRAAHRG
jgi:hypothetical protein